MKPIRPRPVPDDRSAGYWQAAASEVLAIQRCRSCRTWAHPPQACCEHCASLELAYEPVAGTGTVHQCVIVRRTRVAGFEATPYAAVAVELDEQPGLLVLANLVGTPADEARVGQRVRLVFERIDDELVLPQFKFLDEAEVGG